MWPILAVFFESCLTRAIAGPKVALQSGMFKLKARFLCVCLSTDIQTSIEV